MSYNDLCAIKPNQTKSKIADKPTEEIINSRLDIKLTR